MKVFLIVEGDSDKIVLAGQNNWFDSLGLEVDFVITYGKKEMIKAAMRHYKIAIINGANHIIFLPDQNSDKCPLVTRHKIGIDSMDRAVTITIKRELEAWILADGECIQKTIGSSYRPTGLTDVENHPKEKLQDLIRPKLGYKPLSVESAKMFAPNFSIVRAANNNNSARRFKEFFENITGAIRSN